MTMLERVARAMKEEFTRQWGPDAGDPWPAIVRAAFDAMERPTEEMVAAGKRIGADYPEGVYTAMIRAAKEG